MRNSRSAGSTILSTKLFTPKPRGTSVERRRLNSILDEASAAILVSAPAGFGKSTALANWLQTADVDAAWLSLEEADDEPRRFVSYVAAALGQLSPGLSGVLEPLAKGPRLPSAEAALLPLLNELSTLERRTVLILDDYHVIESETIHELLEFWIEHQPASFQIAILSRVDPPFPIPRWRGQARLTELRAAELRFSEEESCRFLEESMGLELQREHANALAERTEGWIVGLQMAALSLRGLDDHSRFVNAFTASNRYVLDYLVQEVVERQPPERIETLLRLSIFDRFCAELLGAALEIQDGEKVIDDLEAANLFLIPLDEERRWYRLHHLFRQLLEKQLSQRLQQNDIAELRTRACDWLAQEGLADEALSQALAAKDRSRTLSLLGTSAEHLLLCGHATTTMERFDRVPHDWLEGHPRIELLRALALFLTMRWRELEDSSKLWEPEPHSTSELDAATRGLASVVLTCVATTHAKRGTVIDSARHALELLSPEQRLLRALASSSLGTALFLNSEYESARSALNAALQWSQQVDRSLEATCRYYLAHMDLVCGRAHDSLQQHASTWATAVSTASPHPMSSLSLVGQAEVHYEWGDLELAAELAERALEVNRSCFPFNELRARVALVSIAQARRDYDGALRMLDQISELMRHALLPPWIQFVDLHRVRTLALKASLEDDSHAGGEWRRWVEQSKFSSSDALESRLLPEEPQTAAVTLWIRYQIHQGNSEETLPLLAQLRSQASRRQWCRALVEAWLLEARAQHDRDEPVTQKALEMAFATAQPGQFVQVIGEESRWLGRLSPEVLEAALSATEPGFRDRIRGVLAQTPGSSPELPPPASLPEPLSQREVEVLEVVATGATNATVGNTLFISPMTVKKHLENIYAKLGVHNRLEAVSRAQSLGLLPSGDEGD